LVSLSWPWEGYDGDITSTTNANIINTSSSPGNPSDQSLQTIFPSGLLSNQGPNLYYAGIVGLVFESGVDPGSLQDVFNANPSYNAISADVQFNWQNIPAGATYSVQLGFKTSLGDYWLNTATPTTGTLANNNTWTTLTWTLTPAQVALIGNFPNSPTWGFMVFAIQTSTDVTDTNTITVNLDNVQAFDAISKNANLTITNSGANIILNWSTGTLLEATNLSGPWTTNINAAPYTVPATARQKFYRVRLQ
jgi:hypothetical protein